MKNVLTIVANRFEWSVMSVNSVYFRWACRQNFGGSCIAVALGADVSISVFRADGRAVGASGIG